jgi:hypothetical protein
LRAGKRSTLALEAAFDGGRNWIKDFKLHLKADRLSCHRFLANQSRLLLHAAAYWLMDALRRRFLASGTRRMQLDTLRLSGTLSR